MLERGQLRAGTGVIGLQGMEWDQRAGKTSAQTPEPSPTYCTSRFPTIHTRGCSVSRQARQARQEQSASKNAATYSSTRSSARCHPTHIQPRTVCPASLPYLIARQRIAHHLTSCISQVTSLSLVFSTVILLALDEATSRVQVVRCVSHTGFQYTPSSQNCCPISNIIISLS